MGEFLSGMKRVIADAMDETIPTPHQEYLERRRLEEGERSATDNLRRDQLIHLTITLASLYVMALLAKVQAVKDDELITTITEVPQSTSNQSSPSPTTIHSPEDLDAGIIRPE
jgi:hypothetical protein